MICLGSPQVYHAGDPSRTPLSSAFRRLGDYSGSLCRQSKSKAAPRRLVHFEAVVVSKCSASHARSLISAATPPSAASSDPALSCIQRAPRNHTVRLIWCTLGSPPVKHETVAGCLASHPPDFCHAASSTVSPVYTDNKVHYYYFICNGQCAGVPIV